MVIAIYGNGKGKTTSAIGTLLRSLNLGKKVLFVQLYKNIKNIKSNEVEFLFKLCKSDDYKKLLTVKQFGKEKGWVIFDKPTDLDFTITDDAMKYVIQSIENKGYNLIVFDEILLAEFFKLAKTKELINLINLAQEKSIDLILTGNKMSLAIQKHCDLISEVKKIKHPFDKGVFAKEGIEF